MAQEHKSEQHRRHLLDNVAAKVEQDVIQVPEEQQRSGGIQGVLDKR